MPFGDQYRIAQFQQKGDYCVALCAHWLLLRYLEMGSGTEGGRNRILGLDEARAARAMEGGGNAIEQPRRVLQEYQLGIGLNNILPSIDVICTKATEVKRRMHMFIINCEAILANPHAQVANHALAVYLSKGGRVHFFDPNFGEFMMKKSEFRQFLTGFLQNEYGAQSGVDIFPVSYQPH